MARQSLYDFYLNDRPVEFGLDNRVLKFYLNTGAIEFILNGRQEVDGDGWILTTGIWNDNEIWDNNGIWKDNP